jgi:hypothetical protein
MSVNPNEPIQRGALLSGMGTASGYDDQQSAINAALKDANIMLNDIASRHPVGIQMNSLSISHSVTWTTVDHWCASVIISGVAG